jgi:hypothetical protein
MPSSKWVSCKKVIEHFCVFIHSTTLFRFSLPWIPLTFKLHKFIIFLEIILFMSHINRNTNSIHNYNLTPSLKKYIECLTIHDNTFSNIYIVYLHIFSSMFYNP